MNRIYHTARNGTTLARSLADVVCWPSTPPLSPMATPAATAVCDRRLIALQIRGEVKFDFPQYLEKRAQQLAGTAPADVAQRTTFDRLSLAIDDPHTSEVDDALRVDARPGGGWDVTVHVADPSALVAQGEPLDLEAMQRCDPLPANLAAPASCLRTCLHSSCVGL